ncbi:Phage T7 capsid assembly protein [Luteibacter sp. 22Crub2.1]|nr:Phage T7 capsid assembly protein [Luteibacter sp. 22Crub2.1]
MAIDAPTPEAQVEAPKPYGGYSSVEELIAAHTALVEKSGTAPAAVETETPATETPNTEAKQEGLEIPSDKDAKETVASAGLDWDGLNSEYAEHGKLTDETYEKLAKGGIPREAVDTYIRGKQAEVAAYETAVFGTAGSVEDYGSLVAWAKEGYSDTEKKAFNDAVTSGDVARAQLAVEALKARYSAKRGAPPANLLKGGSDAAGVQPYKSRVEMTNDMRDKRYKTDPAFREQVLNRLRQSQF